jgi:LemA protein
MQNNKGLFITLGIILLLVFGYIYYYNSFINLEEEINGRWAEIENNLQRRADLIPNLVATVKGYASHEEEIFTEIAQARSRLLGAQGVADTVQASAAMESALGRLLAIVEAYPQLKADRSFLGLQDELAGTENRLSVARLRYNEAVKAYNARIRRLPARIVAGMMGLEAKEYFQIEEAARELPKVEF